MKDINIYVFFLSYEKKIKKLKNLLPLFEQIQA